MVVPRAAVLDVVAVLLFVVVGRRSHGESALVVALAETAWPFLVGAALGWVVAVSVGRPLSSPVAGLAGWVCVVVAGLSLRSASGGGTPPSFVVVTAVVLGVLLVGWRVVGSVLERRRSDFPGAVRR